MNAGLVPPVHLWQMTLEGQHAGLFQLHQSLLC